ncbi:MlaE family ABC transporter permease [Roseateles sp.]|jgi:phospholipid/cholesterol/gamma-HCH transport system permease protein|uniref:MlaE family ABC transporter permease n=1 Tax=Roseateles sp. TaxID=1971397 RepID=UPI0037C6E7CD
MSAELAPATALWIRQPESLQLKLSGDWRGRAQLPPPPEDLPTGQLLMIETSQLTEYDSGLAAALWALAADRGLRLDVAGLPEGLREVLQLAGEGAPLRLVPPEGLLLQIGRPVGLRLRRARTTLVFIGEVLQAAGRALRGRSAMRRSDLMVQLQATGPASLGIVSLVCGLVGLIIAYMGAAQLQRFGAHIYMADLVTVGVVREVAALMTGVILAGRVGAAFAAQLGSMQANEEVDALRSMGLNPVEHLVLPRVLAMTLMAPLLTAYAALVGCAAGLAVAVGIFDLEPFEYLSRSRESLTFAHLGIGLFKGTVYALLVALAGCRQGMYAGRSAQAVGDATTAAVVQAIVWITVAASALTIMFQQLDW